MALTPIQDRYNELVGFFQWWLPTYLPNVNLYLEGQSSPRPANPYISFKPIDEIEYIGNDEVRFYADGSEKLIGYRHIVCKVSAYSNSSTRFDGGVNAWQLLQELRFSLNYASVREKLLLIQSSVVDEGTVEDTSTTLNTDTEPQATLMFTLSTIIEQVTDSGSIETVNGSGLITGTKDITVDFTATKPV